jgi:thiosulfate oxidation carrier complex protein SoxZ
MSTDIGYTRLFMPAKAAAGAVVRVRALITHPMDPVERDPDGKVIPKDYVYIHTIRAYFDGEEILVAHAGQSTSTNPLYSFNLRVPRSGEVKVEFEDTANAKYSAVKRIQVG